MRPVVRFISGALAAAVIALVPAADAGASPPRLLRTAPMDNFYTSSEAVTVGSTINAVISRENPFTVFRQLVHVVRPASGPATETVIDAGSSDGNRGVQVALDGSNRVHVVVCDLTDPSEQSIRHGVLTGSTWTFTTQHLGVGECPYVIELGRVGGRMTLLMWGASAGEDNPRTKGFRLIDVNDPTSPTAPVTYENFREYPYLTTGTALENRLEIFTFRKGGAVYRHTATTQTTVAAPVYVTRGDIDFWYSYVPVGSMESIRPDIVAFHRFRAATNGKNVSLTVPRAEFTGGRRIQGAKLVTVGGPFDLWPTVREWGDIREPSTGLLMSAIAAAMPVVLAYGFTTVQLVDYNPMVGPVFGDVRLEAGRGWTLFADTFFHPILANASTPVGTFVLTHDHPVVIRFAGGAGDRLYEWNG